MLFQYTHCTKPQLDSLVPPDAALHRVAETDNVSDAPIVRSSYATHQLAGVSAGGVGGSSTILWAPEATVA